MILLYAILSGIMISVCIVWLYFLLYTIMSLRRSPCLRQFATKGGLNTGKVDTTKYDLPMVSIIIPARNEENYVDMFKTNISKFRNRSR
jgi:cellulose synthase/poly-beta-1,6-N-acetylglucosamine synthase-like glycosyltransferase